MAAARRKDALNSSHDRQVHNRSCLTQGSERSLAQSRSPAQNSRAWSKQTCSGFDTILIVAGCPQ